MDNLNPRLKKTLTEALKEPEIGYEDSIESIGLWDSMMHMEIMVALEKEFAIRIEPDEIIKLTSVKTIQKYLNGKGVL